MSGPIVADIISTNLRALPKSDNLATPYSLNKTLDGLKSQYTI